VKNLDATTLTTNEWEKSIPITMACLMGLGLAAAARSTEATFDDWAVQHEVGFSIVSAKHDLKHGHELIGTSLSVVDSPVFDFTASEEEFIDPAIAFSYVKSMAVLPIDEAAEVAADKYFAKKTKEPRKVVLSAR
jgi:hypothetical protein